MTERMDFRQELTDRLIGQLEAGTAPWQKPWDSREGLALPYNPTTGKPYRGANSLYLTLHGRGDPRWATYKQAAEQGWQVRKGEKGALVEYWKFSDTVPVVDGGGKTVVGDGGKPKTRTVEFERPKVFRAVVFNAGQMDGVPPLPKGSRMYEWDPLERAEAILQASGAQIFHDQNDRAFYSPARDEVHLPGRDQFPNPTAYYSTALHELGHWSGHGTRLGRDLGHAFGSAEYAKEELRAELASYFLADKLGVPHDIGDHAAYVKSWIRVLQEDRNEIFRASRDAERITEYVLGLDRTRTREEGASRVPQEACEGGTRPVEATPQRTNRDVHLAVLTETMQAQGFDEKSVTKAREKAAALLDRLASQGAAVPAPRVFDGQAQQRTTRTLADERPAPRPGPSPASPER